MESEEINLNNVCRTCKNESPEMKSLYHRHSENGKEYPRFDEMLMACTSVMVKNEDDLPKIICGTCFGQLKNAYCFKEQCEKTDVFLRDYLKKLNRGVVQEKDEEEYASNVLAASESTSIDANNDNDIIENNIDDSESQSRYKDLDYVQVFRNHTIYKCGTCCENVYTIEDLKNHKKDQHNMQIDIDENMGGYLNQADEHEAEVERDALDVGDDLIEPKVEVFENNNQDKIDEIAQITSEIYTEENLPQMFVDMASIEDEIHRECEEFEGGANLDADNGIEYETEGNADSECLSGNSRTYPVEDEPSSDRPRAHPPKKFSNNFNRHKPSHANPKPFLCVVCKKGFGRKGHLASHMKVHSGKDSHSCDVCEKVFNEEANLARHKAAKHNLNRKVLVRERKFKCEYCEKGFTNEILRDTHVQAHFKKFQCSTCEKTFKSKRHLTMHVKIHDSNSKKFLCTECGKGFIRNDYLAMHMRRHRGEEPFKCKFCSKGFQRVYDLTVHERCHTGEKTHLCVICGKGFGRSGNFRIHMRTHTGEKPYRCTHCDAAFAQGSDLKAHIRRHTGERFKCELCPESFLVRYLLTQHKRAVHGLNIVSNARKLLQVSELNPDDAPPITVPLPTPDAASAVPSDALQTEKSDTPELKQE